MSRTSIRWKESSSLSGFFLDAIQEPFRQAEHCFSAQPPVRGYLEVAALADFSEAQVWLTHSHLHEKFFHSANSYWV